LIPFSSDLDTIGGISIVSEKLESTCYTAVPPNPKAMIVETRLNLDILISFYFY